MAPGCAWTHGASRGPRRMPILLLIAEGRADPRLRLLLLIAQGRADPRLRLRQIMAKCFPLIG